MLDYSEEVPVCQKAGYSMSKGMHTPWGVAETKQQLAVGVYLVRTAGHGGILIDKTVAPDMLSEKARLVGKPWEAFLAFEQEHEMMVVLYEHPELYPWVEEELTEKFAEDSLREYHPEYFAG